MVKLFLWYPGAGFLSKFLLHVKKNKIRGHSSGRVELLRYCLEDRLKHRNDEALLAAAMTGFTWSSVWLIEDLGGAQQ